ncbi:MAG: F0F1 ATP synthase subunit delta [Actinomycetota bacterium]|nr:F0F1 ATP synthase subunit delta [Actinomycetota bacterium]
MTGTEVDLKVVVDPDVVGGVIVKVGDTVVDGSIARRLSELRARLAGA